MMEEQHRENSRRRVLKANSNKEVPDGVPQKTPSGMTITYSTRYIGRLLTPDIAKYSIDQKLKDLEQKQSSQAQA